MAILGLMALNCVNAEPSHSSIKSDVAVVSKTKLIHPTKNAEIVFCLDATGSMSGLISTAKEKIWDIVSELAQDGSIDTLKLGMVFYRDRGDNFVTKQIAMTTDLDEVYTELLELTADGGGDTPESVNQALYESITQLQWSKGRGTYRTIFVVGDCPPHMDYQNDIKYTESCKLAAKKGITINTIKLGQSCREAIHHFKNMSNCTNGQFLMLDQNAQDYIVATPYDHEINELSRAIEDTRMYYGTAKERKYNYLKKAKSMEVYDTGSSTANSARAAYKQSNAGQKAFYGSKELIKDYEDGKLKLDSIEDAELPEQLQGKTLSEKEQLIKTIVDKRNTDTQKLNKLLEQKREYIKQKAKDNNGKRSFSKEVLEVIKKQANKNEI